LYRNGNTQLCPDWGPELVVQEERLRVGAEQEEVEEMEQSPQLPVTTVPVESVSVAHQGTGDSA